jgi:3-dehydroquinate dehydratase-2
VIEVLAHLERAQESRFSSLHLARADGVIVGYGINGYAAAVRQICDLISAS